MRTVSGQPVSAGVAIGTLYLYRREKPVISRAAAGTPDEEWTRFRAACIRAGQQLTGLYEQSRDTLGEEAASIFSIHRLMLDDIVYLDAVRALLDNEGVSAAWAAGTAGERLAEMFAAMEDAYMRSRAADVRDVSRRVAEILSGGESAIRLDEPVIVAAEDLSPSEVMQLDPACLLGVVLTRGSSNSHAAILARTLSLPALIGVQVEEDWGGCAAVLDGEGGLLHIDPTEALCAQARARRDDLRAQKERLKALRGLPAVTCGGQRVVLCANVGSLADVDAAVQNDAEGVGLFRSEMLYMDPNEPPTEERQFAIYRDALQRMEGRPVVVRTLDIGADKLSPFVPLDPEENPALGMRGVRVSLARPEILRTQLRALVRASAFGPLSIMLPMVICVEEVQAVRKALAACRRELSEEGVPIGETKLGIMIETPAAALTADALAQEADFFSIGTNDLTQYTLALDRVDPHLGHLCDPYHPAILQLMEMAVQAAHRCGREVCVCGELAADTRMTETFLRMGVDSLSVAPPAILPLKEHICAL